MIVIMICLGDPEMTQSELLRMLSVLFTDEKSAEEKRQIFIDEFDIKMTKNIESEVAELCNYGDYVWMKGITQGEVKKLIKIVCNMFSKGTDPAGIADTLGEEPLLVEEICQAATLLSPFWYLRHSCHKHRQIYLRCHSPLVIIK